MTDTLQSIFGCYVGHWKNRRFVVQIILYCDAIGMKDEIYNTEVLDNNCGAFSVNLFVGKHVHFLPTYKRCVGIFPSSISEVGAGWNICIILDAHISVRIHN